MINKLAKIIKALKPIYYECIEVLDDKLVISARNLPEFATQNKVLSEVLQIIHAIDTNIYYWTWEYEDKDNILPAFPKNYTYKLI